MHTAVEISHYEGELRRQYAGILQSKEKALEKLAADCSLQLLGLSIADPLALWHFAVRQCSFRDALQAILDTVQEDAELPGHVESLQKLNQSEPLTRLEFVSNLDRTKVLLAENWIFRRSDPNWIKNSLCVYSDKALAKLLFFLRRKGPPSAKDLSDLVEKAPGRVRKARKQLGLISARPLLFKDLEWKGGAISYLPFKKRTPGRRKPERKPA